MPSEDSQVESHVLRDRFARTNVNRDELNATGLPRGAAEG